MLQEYSKINIDNYNNIFKNTIVLSYINNIDTLYNNYQLDQYQKLNSFFETTLKEWSFVAIVTDCSDDEYITVSTVDIETKESVYKLIPKKEINFTCSENDYILINIKQFVDIGKPKFKYKISQYTPPSRDKNKKRIIEKISQRTNEKDII